MAECEQGKLLGMDGKTLIHPGQIGPANVALAPTTDDIAQAQEIIAAFEQPENRGLGVINLNGRMIELLHCEMARKTVALSQAIEAMEAQA